MFLSEQGGASCRIKLSANYRNLHPLFFCFSTFLIRFSLYFCDWGNIRPQVILEWLIYCCFGGNDVNVYALIICDFQQSSYLARRTNFAVKTESVHSFELDWWGCEANSIFKRLSFLFSVIMRQWRCPSVLKNDHVFTMLRLFCYQHGLFQIMVLPTYVCWQWNMHAAMLTLTWYQHGSNLVSILFHLGHCRAIWPILYHVDAMLTPFWRQHPTNMVIF